MPMAKILLVILMAQMVVRAGVCQQTDEVPPVADVIEHSGQPISINSGPSYLALNPPGAAWGKIEGTSLTGSMLPTGSVVLHLDSVDGPVVILADIRGHGRVWSPPIQARHVCIVVKLAHTSIKVTRLMGAFQPLRTDSQIGTKFNSWPLNHSAAAAVEGAISGVALLHYGKILNGVLKVMPCTGFLVGIQAIVTNYHCIDSNERAITAEVYFDFDEPGGVLPPSPIRVLRAIVLDPSLDLAVLDLEEAPTRTVSRS